jgi:hypothetical protein
MPGFSPLQATTLGSNFSFGHWNYTVGPQIETRLIGGLSLEFDALYKFPILVKAHLGALRGHRSFVAAGPSFRSIWWIRDVIAGQKTTVGSAGFTIASGSEFRVGAVIFCPEVRYTHWGAITFGNGLDLVLGNRKNQTQFLFGMVF